MDFDGYLIVNSFNKPSFLGNGNDRASNWNLGKIFSE